MQIRIIVDICGVLVLLTDLHYSFSDSKTMQTHMHNKSIKSYQYTQYILNEFTPECFSISGNNFTPFHFPPSNCLPVTLCRSSDSVCLCLFISVVFVILLLHFFFLNAISSSDDLTGAVLFLKEHLLVQLFCTAYTHTLRHKSHIKSSSSAFYAET